VKSSVFLDTVQAQIRAVLERGRALGEDIPTDELNWQPAPERWSIGQIYDHMNLATDSYIPPMQKAIEAGAKGSDLEAINTWFGKLVIKSSGPAGNAPVPKKLAPGEGPFNRTVITKFIEHHEEVLRLLEESRDKDISSITIKNPVLGAFRMNIVDCLAAIAAHAERHVGQVEALKREAALRLKS